MVASSIALFSCTCSLCASLLPVAIIIACAFIIVLLPLLLVAADLFHALLHIHTVAFLKALPKACMLVALGQFHLKL